MVHPSRLKHLVFAVVVLSALAVGGAFVAAGATTASAPTPGYDPVEPFVGQTVTATADVRTAGEPDLSDGLAAGEYTLERVTDTVGGEVVDSRFVEGLSIDDQDPKRADRIVIETADLDPGERYFVAGPAFPDSPRVDGETFQTRELNLTVAFEDDVVANRGFDAETAVKLDTNRATYDLYVVADGDLDADELQGIFFDLGREFDGITRGTDANDGFGVAEEVGVDADEIIRIEGVSDRSFGDGVETNFRELETGTYTFTFYETETMDADAVEVEVREEVTDATWSAERYTIPAGDVVRVDLALVDTDEVWIQLGDPEAGFVDVLHVADGDDSGGVQFWINTRTLGTASAERVYHAPDDEVTSMVADGTDAAAFEDVSFGDHEDVVGYLDALGLVEAEAGEGKYDQLVRPVEPGELALVASGNGVFGTDDGEPSVDVELDRAVLELTEPGIEAVTTKTAPRAAPGDESLGTTLDRATQTSTVATGDRLVVEADMTGVLGALVEASAEGWSGLETGFAGESLDALRSLDGEGVSVTLEAVDRGAQEGAPLDLVTADEAGLRVWGDPANETVVFVVDTGAVAPGESADVFEADVTVEYAAHDEARFAFDAAGGPSASTWRGGADGRTDEEAFPYLADGAETLRGTATVAVERPSATFASFDDGAVRLGTEDGARLEGETNLAPGSPVDVRVSHRFIDDGHLRFIYAERAEIGPDGSFESDRFPFGDRLDGSEAIVSFRLDGRAIDEYVAVFGSGEVTPDPTFAVGGVAPSAVDRGDDASLEVEFSNLGPVGGASPFAVTIDGETVDAADELAVDAGDDLTKTYEIPTAEPGTVEWAVEYGDAVAAGTVDVEGEVDSDDTDDSADRDDEHETDDADGLAGFGVTIALVALLSWLMVAHRRRACGLFRRPA